MSYVFCLSFACMPLFGRSLVVLPDFALVAGAGSMATVQMGCVGRVGLLERGCYVWVLIRGWCCRGFQSGIISQSRYGG